MTWIARGLTYACALLLVIGAAAPWVMVDGAAGGASPLGVAIAFGAALVAVVSAYAQRRTAVALTGVAVTALAVLVIFALPGGALMAGSAAAAADAATTAGAGLYLIAVAGLGLYLTARIPAPQPRAQDAPPALTADA